MLSFTHMSSCEGFLQTSCLGGDDSMPMLLLASLKSLYLPNLGGVEFICLHSSLHVVLFLFLGDMVDLLELPCVIQGSQFDVCDENHTIQDMMALSSFILFSLRCLNLQDLVTIMATSLSNFPICSSLIFIQNNNQPCTAKVSLYYCGLY